MTDQLRFLLQYPELRFCVALAFGVALGAMLTLAHMGKLVCERSRPPKRALLMVIQLVWVAFGLCSVLTFVEINFALSTAFGPRHLYDGLGLIGGPIAALMVFRATWRAMAADIVESSGP